MRSLMGMEAVAQGVGTMYKHYQPIPGLDVAVGLLCVPQIPQVSVLVDSCPSSTA